MATRLKGYWDKFVNLDRERLKLFVEFSQDSQGKDESSLGVIRIPEYNQDIAGLKDLQNLAAQLATSG